MKSNKIVSDYTRYRWFFTSSGKLVVGGKSALQNDDLLKKLKHEKNDFVVMHTAEPGSPFAVILAPKKNVTKSDKEEAAVFTGSFSRAWRAGKKKVEIHIFSLSQVFKLRSMKAGTWGVKPPITKKVVTLELVLTKQESRLRAVPRRTVKKKGRLLTITPGTMPKREMLPKLHIEIDESLSEEEILSSLPTGGSSLRKK